MQGRGRPSITRLRFGTKPARNSSSIASPDFRNALSHRSHKTWRPPPESLLAFERARMSIFGVMTTTNGTKTWIITGASSGLGLALAEAALAAGEQVLGTARRAGRFDALRAQYGD